MPAARLPTNPPPHPSVATAPPSSLAAAAAALLRHAAAAAAGGGGGSGALAPKLALVLRADLVAGRGKLAAMAAHAAVDAYRAAAADSRAPARRLLRAWEAAGQPKIVLRCGPGGGGGGGSGGPAGDGDGEAQLLALLHAARSAGAMSGGADGDSGDGDVGAASASGGGGGGCGGGSGGGGGGGGGGGVPLIARLVRDAGLTQVPAGSAMALAVFGRSRDVDAITGHLKLL